MTELQDLKNTARTFYSPGRPSSEEDFQEDVRRTVLVKKALNRWRDGRTVNLRGAVNAVVVLFNVFPPDFTRRLLVSAVGPENRVQINTVFLYLRRSTDFADVDRTLFRDLKREVDR